jgi:uncharacterized protein (DUF1800 family)
MLPTARWQQRCTGWMEPSKQALKSGILACTLLTSPAFALSVDDAKHLALRTSFAANPSLMNALLPLTREEAVDYVLNQVEPHPVEPPEFVLNPFLKVDLSKLSSNERKEYDKERNDEILDLRQWWIEKMVSTRSPIQEIMTLFWSNYFTSSSYKPFDPVIAYRQNQIIRNQALGRFDLLLDDVMKDPALLIYLDNHKNIKDSPNENLARELLELYTLGEGNYTEGDIKEVARSLTGWGVVWNDRRFKFDIENHDSGVKKIFGKEGRFTALDVIHILLERKETSEHVIKKMWEYFISQEYSEDDISSMAKRFRENGYDIKLSLRELLLSEKFWEKRNRAVLVKSPIELMVGLYRQEGVKKLPYGFIVKLTNGMGQSLFAPPNVKGWPVASVEWINTESLLKRQNAIVRLMRAKESNPNMTDEEAVLNEAMQQWANSEAFNYQKDWLLAAPPVGEFESDDPMETLKNLLTDPVYQLK